MAESELGERLHIVIDDYGMSFFNYPKHLLKDRVFMVKMEALKEQIMKLVDEHSLKYQQRMADIDYVMKVL